MLTNKKMPILKKFVIGFGLPLILTLVGCGDDGSGTRGSASTMSISMDIPDSMTGGHNTVASASLVAASRRGSGAPCAFVGGDDEDPFRNGYEITKMLVSAISSWTCVADNVIIIANSEAIPHDGDIHETENDRQTAGYNPEDPTHYSVTDDSDTQVTLRLYYGYDRITPPVISADPQFYISWNELGNGQIDGRMIIDGMGIDKDKISRKVEDPTFMRMDFTFNETAENADMFLRFDNGNPWAEGFRIMVNKDLNASPMAQVFTAKGLIDMKAQFLPVSGISELPAIKMFAVSDIFGEGAAIAELSDVSLPLVLNTGTGNNLGDYLLSKVDQYFFDANQAANRPWDWVQKDISVAEYRGGRTTPATGGTWIPFDPSLDLLEAFEGLDLGTGYFDNTCNAVNTDCTALLNALHTYSDGFAGQEPNQGQDPMDWRSTALANASYIDSIYPNGLNWDGAFDFFFTPASTPAP